MSSTTITAEQRAEAQQIAEQVINSPHDIIAQFGKVWYDFHAIKMPIEQLIRYAREEVVAKYRTFHEYIVPRATAYREHRAKVIAAWQQGQHDVSAEHDMVENIVPRVHGILSEDFVLFQPREHCAPAGLHFVCKFPFPISGRILAIDPCYVYGRGNKGTQDYKRILRNGWLLNLSAWTRYLHQCDYAMGYVLVNENPLKSDALYLMYGNYKPEDVTRWELVHIIDVDSGSVAFVNTEKIEHMARLKPPFQTIDSADDWMTSQEQLMRNFDGFGDYGLTSDDVAFTMGAHRGDQGYGVLVGYDAQGFSVGVCIDTNYVHYRFEDEDRI